MVNLDQKGSDGMSYYVKIYEDVLRCRGWNSSHKYQLCERKSEESLPTGDPRHVFGLPETGIVDYRTWYKIQEIFVGVTRIAELNP